MDTEFSQISKAKQKVAFESRLVVDALDTAIEFVEDFQEAFKLVDETEEGKQLYFKSLELIKERYDSAMKSNPYLVGIMNHISDTLKIRTMRV